MRSDIISVLKNDTIISLYGIQQTFSDGDKMNLLIVRKSIRIYLPNLNRHLSGNRNAIVMRTQQQ